MTAATELDLYGDHVLPILKRQTGLVDEIVIVSAAEPDHVLARAPFPHHNYSESVTLASPEIRDLATQDS